MKTQKRYLTAQVAHDLKKKMVFLAGPRQVGKTTLAKQLLGAQTQGYLNWDIGAHREAILKEEYPDTPMWVFDEIHKYKNWRDYIKGVYDAHGDQHQILVTGSARLDYYRRGGDSLQGRYHYLRMLPLSVAELEIKTQNDFIELLTLGGFPEQFFLHSEIESARWSREYRQRLLEEDIRTLEKVTDIGTMELLMLRLPDVVGSPLSINALREDLQVSHRAVSNWLTIFERLYAIFRLSPFGSPLIRAVKKEQKHYHYDWTLIEKESLRFENMVALSLLKWVYYEQDTKGRDIELRYFRDIDRREVDFILVENGNPIQAIECKLSDANLSKSLQYFKNKFPACDAWQLHAKGKKNYISGGGIKVAPALEYLSKLV